MFRERPLRRVGLVASLGLCLSLGTAGISSAAPAGDSGITACPAHGKRFQQTGSSDPKRVYLAGPDNVAYAIPSEAVYFSLWRTWDGIQQWPRDTVASCFGGAQILYFTGLYRDPNGQIDPRRVYIYDGRTEMNRYRWITSEAVFNQYAFDPLKIQLGPVTPEEISNDNWDN